MILLRLVRSGLAFWCSSLTWRCLRLWLSLESYVRYRFAIWKLNHILALFHILQVISNNPTGIGAHRNCASICAEPNSGRFFTLWQCDLLVRARARGAVLVDVYLLHFFTLGDVVELDSIIHAAGCEQKMVDLGKAYTGARLAAVACEYKLLGWCASRCIIWLWKDIGGVPDDYLPILVGWGKDMALHTRKSRLRHFTSVALFLGMQ